MVSIALITCTVSVMHSNFVCKPLEMHSKCIQISVKVRVIVNNLLPVPVFGLIEVRSQITAEP